MMQSKFKPSPSRSFFSGVFAREESFQHSSTGDYELAQDAEHETMSKTISGTAQFRKVDMKEAGYSVIGILKQRRDED